MSTWIPKSWAKPHCQLDHGSLFFAAALWLWPLIAAHWDTWAGTLPHPPLKHFVSMAMFSLKFRPGKVVFSSKGAVKLTELYRSCVWAGTLSGTDKCRFETFRLITFFNFKSKTFLLCWSRKRVIEISLLCFAPLQWAVWRLLSASTGTRSRSRATMEPWKQKTSSSLNGNMWVTAEVNGFKMVKSVWHPLTVSEPRPVWVHMSCIRPCTCASIWHCMRRGVEKEKHCNLIWSGSQMWQTDM